MKLAFYLGRKETNPAAWLFDRLVCYWTRGDFSHVELVVGGTDKEALCWSSSYRDHGVRRKQIDITSGRWAIVELPKSADALYAQMWFLEHAKEKYDIAGLFGFVLPWRIENKKRWFCSEAVAAALQMKDPWRISPNDLYRIVTAPAHAGFFTS